MLGGRKLTPQEALDRGLITDVVPEREFRDFIEKKTKELASLPPKVRLIYFFLYDIWEVKSLKNVVYLNLTIRKIDSNSSISYLAR